MGTISNEFYQGQLTTILFYFTLFYFILFYFAISEDMASKREKNLPNLFKF